LFAAVVPFDLNLPPPQQLDLVSMFLNEIDLFNFKLIKFKVQNSFVRMAEKLTKNL